MMLERSRALLAALWGGFLLCVAFVAAPTAFAVLERAQAILFVNRLFELDANISLAAAVLLMLIERRLRRDEQGSSFRLEFWLPTAALFCTVAGYHALQPMMAQARVGQGALSFGALHGISMGFYGIKLLLILALAWRAGKAR